MQSFTSMVADNAQSCRHPEVKPGESQQQTAPTSRGARRPMPCRSPAPPILPTGRAFAVHPVVRQHAARFRACQLREPAPAAGMTAGTVIRASLAVPGQPDQVHAARVFVGEALGADHPCAVLAVLLASELVTNSVLHSDSRLPGGMVTITVTASPQGARVEVRDAGGTSVPVPGDADDELAEHGRGLRLVRDLSARWDYRREDDEIITWFEVSPP